jgi:hypothetical protein
MGFGETSIHEYGVLRCMRTRAILLVVIFLSSAIILPNNIISPVNAGEVSTFGNNGHPQSISISFNSSGYDSQTNLSLGANSVITSASMGVRGKADTAGNSPTTIGIDVGNDGDLDWAFGGAGNGSFGHQTEFSNGHSQIGVNLSSGANNSYSIRLPADAVVNSAQVNFSTLSELTISGSGVKDSHMRQPNTQYSSAAIMDYNYGASNQTVCGKTVWANWNIYRSVYWFDLSQIPSVTILDANMSFYVANAVNPAGSSQPVTALHTYTIYPLLKDWEEGQEYGASVQQGPGVTWNNAIDNVTGSDYAWNIGGTGALDRSTTGVSITDSPANLKHTWLSYDSQGLENIVQSWINGSTTNFGVVMQGDENTNKPDGSVLYFPASNNATYGPKLVVVFAGSDEITATFDLGADGVLEWNHTGNLSGGSSSPDLTNSINSYLQNATPSFTDSWGNDFVDIPLNITGNATLVLSDLDIIYDWNPTVSVSPHGDLANEISQHFANLTPDATGNVSIPINVTSGSAGIIELFNLSIVSGDRPPSIGSIILTTDIMVPNNSTYSVGLQVTSYQELANLSWVSLTPQLTNTQYKPILYYSLSNSSTWVIDASGAIANVSGNWSPQNSDTAEMIWDISPSWNWAEEEDVVWLAQTSTVDSLNTNRYSTQMTSHERRMEIASFNVWDETSPSDGGPEVFAGEWLAGGDQLRVSGTVNFLNHSEHPLPSDVLVELENFSGNGSVDANGAFSISSSVPNTNYYDGITVTAIIAGQFDSTPFGVNSRTFQIDATAAGILHHSPISERVIPSDQQLFNISIVDSIGLDEGSLFLRCWVEAVHDDGNGIPDVGEYSSRPLIRYNSSDYFHAIFDDANNAQGQNVSLYVEGFDLAGNKIEGGSLGFENDLFHYYSLVISPTIIQDSSLIMGGGQSIVPNSENWLNFSLQDSNWLEDIEELTIDFGQESEFTWNASAGLLSNDPEIIINYYSFVGDVDNLSLNISFTVSSFYNPIIEQGVFSLLVTDSSGTYNIVTTHNWYLNADIHIIDLTISHISDNGNRTLSDDSYVIQGARLQFSGRVIYNAANSVPNENSIEVSLQVPLDLPLIISIDENGYFSGHMDALSSGLYQVNLQVIAGPGAVNPAPPPMRLLIDDTSPQIVGHAPLFVPANSTGVLLQINIQESDSGIPQAPLQTICQIHKGFDAVGEQITTQAQLQLEGDVSRYLVNLSYPVIAAENTLDCWLEMEDNAGNSITGEGSSASWPLRLTSIENRPDLVITQIEISPSKLYFGSDAWVNVTIANIGNHTGELFWVSLETGVLHEDIYSKEVIANKSVIILPNENSATLSFMWTPDWQGELNLSVIVDSESMISERVEDNTYTQNLLILPAKVDDGFFASQAPMIIGGGAVIFLVALGIFLMRREDSSEYYDEEEWLEENDKDYLDEIDENEG